MNGIRVCLLLLLAATISCSAIDPRSVYDTEGHELSTNASYYILPAPRMFLNVGGGLTSTSAKYRLNLDGCQTEFIQQEDNNTALGRPVMFYPYDWCSKSITGVSQTVRVSTDIHISYPRTLDTCMHATRWHIDYHFKMPRRVVSSPVENSRGSVFRVEEYMDTHMVHGYKLMACKGKCEALGLVKDGKSSVNRLLAVSEPAHIVVFKKAPTNL